MSGEMPKGKAILKVPAVTNPVIEHNLHDFHLSAVVVQIVQTNGTRTIVTPVYTVLDRDRIQLTLSNSGGERWVIISA